MLTVLFNGLIVITAVWLLALVAWAGLSIYNRAVRGDTPAWAWDQWRPVRASRWLLDNAVCAIPYAIAVLWAFVLIYAACVWWL